MSTVLTPCFELLMKMPFIGEDWRAPGCQWIRTEQGWKPLSDIKKNLTVQIANQLRHLTSSRSHSSKSHGSTAHSGRSRNSPDHLSPRQELSTSDEDEGKCSSHMHKRRLGICRSSQKDKELRLDNYQLLSMRCISVRRSSSKESNRYSTISDAVNKMSFQQALYDENCFPFICKVLLILFEGYYQSSSGSLQMALLKITDTAKEIAMDSGKHSGLVVKMIDKAISTNHRIRRTHTGFALKNIDSRIKSLLKMKRQFQESLLESINTTTTTTPNQRGTDFDQLPDDCLHHIITYLSHPRDILNLGLTNMRMHRVSGENQVWRELAYYHYGKTDAEVEPTSPVAWKEIFIQYYQLSRGKLKEEHSYAACICKICNFVFWKSYGHPCCSVVNNDNGIGNMCCGTKNRQPNTAGLTPKEFIAFFNS